MMRYHWGLGVGHTYSYQRALLEHNNTENTIFYQEESTEDVSLQTQNGLTVLEDERTSENNSSDSDDLDGNHLDTDETDSGDGNTSSDEELLAMDDMYSDL